MYSIAERFPEDVRRRVVELWKTNRLYQDGTRLRLPDAGPAEVDYCPLGLCFHEMGIDDHTPNDEEVMRHFLSPMPAWDVMRDDDDIHDLINEAGDFIAGWDDGEIEDLAEAFGVGEA